VPDAVLRQIPADLRDLKRECGGAQLFDLAEAWQLDLQTKAETPLPPLLVKLTGRCASGANNATLLIYSYEQDVWRMLLRVGGNRLRVLSAIHSGWHDVESHGHFSAFEEVRTVYRFEGAQYRQVACHLAQSATIDGQRISPPLLRPCPSR
jgi:hypothetical protein